MRVTLSALPLASALALTACGAGAPPSSAVVPPADAGQAAAGDAAPGAASGLDADGRDSLYTELAGCRTIEAQRDEGGYRLSECEGPAGHALRLLEADGRHNLLVRTPAEDFVSLRLPEQRGGAFSEIAGRVEWRGERLADGAAPDVLVLRYKAWEDPQDPMKATSYLVPVALAPVPCVIAFVAPGPRQSDEARRLADAAPACAPVR